MQNEIIKEINVSKVLKNKNFGYSKHPLIIYDKENLKRKHRLKEWNFYQILTDDYCLQLNIADIKYASLITVDLFNLHTKERYSFNQTEILKKIVTLDNNPEVDSNIYYSNTDKLISFEVKDNKRFLRFEGKNNKYFKYKVDLILTSPIYCDSMNIITPFKNKKNHFYLNYKNNNFIAVGKVEINDLSIDINGYGLLDWGRGVWPYRNNWIWGSFTKKINNDLIGLNIGYGFGDISRASENMLFVNGICYKLGYLDVKITSYNEAYVISDNLNQVSLKMRPIHDNYTCTNFKIVKMECHQVFGFLSGKIIIQNNEVVFDNVLGFIEKCNNRW